MDDIMEQINEDSQSEEEEEDISEDEEIAEEEQEEEEEDQIEQDEQEEEVPTTSSEQKSTAKRFRDSYMTKVTQAFGSDLDTIRQVKSLATIVKISRY